jgi:hypothetical protein
MLFNTIEDANRLASRITKLRNEKRISEEDYERMCGEIAKQFYKMQSRINHHVRISKKGTNNNRKKLSCLSRMTK